MTPTRFAIDGLSAVLPAGGRTLVQGCSAESILLAQATAAAGDALGAMTLTGIQVPGINRYGWLPNEKCRFETFFMTPELRTAGDAVTFLPFCYADILAHLRSTRIDAALFSVSPPDANGLCSFGPTVDFLAELWPEIPRRIAHINPLLPVTAGPTGIPFDAIHAFIEGDATLPEAPDTGADPISLAIAGHVAALIDDGATIQTGLGKLPGAMLRMLVDRRDLRIHSGLIGDAVLELLDSGAIAEGSHITTGVAIGTRRLYDALPASKIRFCPVSYTHDPAVLARIAGFVTVNGAMEVDLYGQAFAEMGQTGWNSGTGGASDFARGAWAAGGLRIVVLPSTGKAASRIVAPGAGRGPVSLGRMEIDIAVTEHGAADLRGLTHDARAAGLIAIAAPDCREALARAWCDCRDRH